MVWLLEKSTCTIWMAMSWLNRILKWYIYLYIYMLIKAFAIYMYFDTLTNLKLFYFAFDQYFTPVIYYHRSVWKSHLRFLSFFPKSIKYQVPDLLILEKVWKYLTKNKDLRAFDHLKKKTIDFISSHSDSWRRSQRHL